MDDANQVIGDEQSSVKQDSTADLANPMKSKTTEELHEMMDEALENEDYELASQIRDEINKRQS